MPSKQPKTVYFIRHGQSIDNETPVYQALDSPLSPRGIAQAQAIGSRMARVPFEALLASSVLRAKQTAEHIAAATKHTVEYSELFVERVKPHEINGKAWSDPDARVIWREWEKSLYTPGLRISDGENFDDTIARADRALAYLADRPEATLTVVTHGYFLRALVARVLIGDSLTGPIMQRFQQRASVENTALTVLRYRDAYEEDFAWRLWTLNDHSHFAE